MVELQHAGNMEGIDLLVAEGLDNGVAGVALVIFSGFLRGQGAAKRNGAMEMIGMGGAITGQGPPRLGEHGGGGAVRVTDAGDSCKGAVEHQMRGGVGGRAEFAFHLAAGGELHDHEVIVTQVGVVDAAGLDHHQARPGIKAADISPGQADQTGGREPEVGFENLLF